MAWTATLVFGGLVLAGGLAGYARARSRMSLAAGVPCGGLLLLAAAAMRDGRAWGFWLALAVSLLLAAVFGMRWRRSGRFMPAGLLLLASLAELAILLLAAGR